MDVYLPYIIVLAVVIVFFLVCYLAFYTTPKKERKQTVDNLYYDRNYYKQKTDYGALYYDADISQPALQDTQPIKPLKEEGRVQVAYESSKNSLEDTLVLKKVGTSLEKDEAEMAHTKIISKEQLELALHNDESLKQQAVQEEVSVPRLQVENASIEDVMVGLGTVNLRQRFGFLDEDEINALEEITAEAIRRLGIHSEEEWKLLLRNLVIQESLEYMQKAYLGVREPWMKETALMLFMDIVKQPKSSTLYLVALDALHVLPHLSLAHFKLLTMVVVIQYSRNSNNFSLEKFRHFVEKYLQPLLDGFPKEESYYHQLKYLRCLDIGRDKESLTELFSKSYPFVFNYRGFTEDELLLALNGETLSSEFVVPSMNSSLYKLSVVDETILPRFFLKAGISDPDTQQSLIHIMKSKPTSFTGGESLSILEHISPKLLELHKIYQASSLGAVELSLLGLYLASIHMKVVIGEEFDLSRWFS